MEFFLITDSMAFQIGVIKFASYNQIYITMYIASKKRKENIAEYLLYMWQIEDLIRANNLDIDLIQKNVIRKSALDYSKQKDEAEWYESLIDMMKREGVSKSGHLQINTNIILMLTDLHRKVLSEPRFPEYAAEFYKTLPYIVELRSKSGDEPAGEIETCFNALYGVLLLRIQGKDISKETNLAIKQISRFISILANYFKLDQEDNLFEDNDQN